MSAVYPEAPALGLRGCECCGLVLSAPPGDAPLRCPRCHLALHSRKPQSVQRTTAFLLTAAVLYIPANLLPVMATSSVLGRDSHTLVGGILELWASGSWELAVIVFIASIAVPLLKIAALALLTWTAHRRSRWRQRERAGLYRLVETVGHWSMLDVFVVVLLVGMVRFGVLASVEPEAGLLAFGAVVVATMLASSSFDPRLIWPASQRHESN
jgi:paraquat-inducible protein A